jgi:hypothetical protein
VILEIDFPAPGTIPGMGIMPAFNSMDLHARYN